MINTRHLAKLLFFAIVIIFTAKFIWNETKSTYSLNLLENIFLDDITALKFSSEGKPIYLLQGNNIKQQQGLNIYNIDNIKIAKQEESAWELTAEKAIWNDPVSELTLKDKVKLLSEQFTATTASLKVTEKTASTKSTVNFHSDTTNITADGMEIDLASSNIKLNRNITGKTITK